MEKYQHFTLFLFFFSTIGIVATYLLVRKSKKIISVVQQID
jgi:hypothetical protein